jgi:membrane protein required for colicin V production
MNALDFVILGVIAFFVIKGIFKGFFREISSLAGIIFGFLVGNHYYPQMSVFLKPYIPLEKSLPLVGFIVLFFLVFIFFSLLGILLHHLFKRLLIGWFDRSLGTFFALIKAVIVCYLLIVLLTFFMPSSSPLIARSNAAHLVIVSYQAMAKLMSPDLYKTWKKQIAKESKKVGKAVKKLPEVLPEKEE